MRIIDVTYPFLVSLVIYLYLKVQHHDTVIAKIDTKLVLNDVEDTQEKDTIEREPYWQKEVLKKNASGKNTNTQVNEDLELLSLGRKSRRLNSNSYEEINPIDAKVTSETALDRSNSGMVDDDDYNNDVASDNNTNNFVFNIAEDLIQSLQSFVCSMGEIVPYGDTFFDGCDGETNEDGSSSINTDDEVINTSTDAATNTGDDSNNNDMVDDDDYNNMASNDDKTIIDMGDDNAVFEEIHNNSNMSSPVSENDNSSSDVIVNSDDNDEYNISTNTTYINDDKISTENDGSYNNNMVDDDDYNNMSNDDYDKAVFENIQNDLNTSSFSNQSSTPSVYTTQPHDDDFRMIDNIYDEHEIPIETTESDTESMDVNVDQPSTYYPFKNIQCKNKKTCVCDSKPGLSTNLKNSDMLYDIKAQTLLGISILSHSNKLQDVESPQYKAACWVLFDDPYQYVFTAQKRILQQNRTDTDLYVEEGAQKRMMQRYALAVLYFSTTPKEWGNQYKFLSASSECEWNKETNNYEGFSIQGSICDDDGNVKSVYLRSNNLNGTIIGELSELKTLEALDLSNNTIQGSIPSIFGQLSKLRYLYLSQNELKGSILPIVFNAKNLEKLELYKNKISETIPETIVNLRQLSSMNLNKNEITGSIPEAMYSLENLQTLNLGSNKFSSSISSKIGNLKKLKTLLLEGNNFNGQIPSRVGELSSLEELNLGKNIFSGSIPSSIGELSLLSVLALDENQLTGLIPESLFNISSLRYLKLQENDVIGSIPDQLCEIDDLDFQANCKNDIFEPQVSCSCCSVCSGKTPTWDNECPDATMKIVIDRSPIDYNGYSYTSGGLEWSITNTATQKKIRLSPLIPEDGDLGGTACVAYSDCISIDMISPPIFNTEYRVYLNNILVDDNIRMFPGSLQQEGSTLEYRNEPFQFDRESKELVSCRDIELSCDGNGTYRKVLVERNSEMISSVSTVLYMFGSQNIRDPTSDLSKALCWLLDNKSDPQYNRRLSESVENDDSYGNYGLLDTEILQRYVLTMLHFSSTHSLFGEDEYPPSSHECEWTGIQCALINGVRIVTGISVSSEYGQIINGTLIDEIGGLQFLETLEMNRIQLYGTIPKTLSNLWSLKKLDLSENELTGALPVNMFRQMNNLEFINFSDNQIRGSINDDIGSFSHIRVLAMMNNSLNGSLPLGEFKYNDLEYLFVNGNELDGVDFQHLMKHTKLKSPLYETEALDLSNNFFVGSLHKDTFTSLSQIEYLNISQNDFSGTIPPAFPEKSNITHFDAHMNKLRGTIPYDITNSSSIQYINLQGNQLTGSLPSEINKLIDTLVLSHNELKGSIPFDPNTLQNIDKLHLHGNNLVGRAPQFSNMTSYITDCGFPSDLSDSVSCPTCSICCNSVDRCRPIKVDQGKRNRTLLFSFGLIGFLVLSYWAKDAIVSFRKFEPFFSESVSEWNALTIINEKSVYHFLLTNNKVGWKVAMGTGVFQILTLFLFVLEASSYSLKCPYYTLNCEDTEPGINATPLGLFLFALILMIWLSRDLISSIKLLILAMYEKNIDILFTGGLVFFITALAAWTSIYYNLATVTTDHELIVNTVILLFVLEADERIYQLAETFTPQWVIDEARFRQSAVFIGDDLIISSSIKNFLEFMQKKKIKRKTQGGNIEDEEYFPNHEKNVSESS